MPLELIRKAPITGTWCQDADIEVAKLSLPYGCVHTNGIFFDRSTSTRAVMTSRLFVPEEYRAKSIATRLLRSGFALAKSEGAETSLSNVESAFALMARLSIFGEGNMTICDDTNAEPLSISVDEAIDILLQGKEDYGFIAQSDLIQVDMSDWELPIMGPKPAQ